MIDIEPEIYHYTADKLGISENECLVIEDSAFGIMAAHSSGMTVAAVIDDRFGFDCSLADDQIQRMEELLELP